MQKLYNPLKTKFIVYKKNIPVAEFFYDGEEYILKYLVDDDKYKLSLTMPVEKKTYRYQIIHPILDQNLPEGLLKEYILKFYQKQLISNDYIPPELILISAIGRYFIGSIKVVPEKEKYEYKKETDKVNIFNILNLKINHSLMNDLFKNYGLYSGISGIFPKVLIELDKRLTLYTNKYILKFNGLDYPYHTINEYFCLKIAKNCNLNVPDFYLSKDHNMLLIERFDRGLYIEEFCTLFGYNSAGKYNRSYEDILTLAQDLNLSYDEKIQLLKRIILTVLIRDGDFHLKNLAIIYDDNFNIKLSPHYDIISTQVYIRNDKLALSLNGTKEWPNSRELIKFLIKTGYISKKEARYLILEIIEGIDKTINKMKKFKYNKHLEEKLIKMMIDLFSKNIAEYKIDMFPLKNHKTKTKTNYKQN